MNAYEISIHIQVDPVGGERGRNSEKGGDAVVYGILPDQAAVDEVMNRLYEIGVHILRANLHSRSTQEYMALAVPQPPSLN
jgi:hypothetical protein